jgi:hypothetical protein
VESPKARVDSNRFRQHDSHQCAADVVTGMAAGAGPRRVNCAAHERSLLPSEAGCSAPHGSPSVGRNAQRRAGVPTNGGLSVLSACRVSFIGARRGLGERGAQRLEPRASGCSGCHVASRLWAECVVDFELRTQQGGVSRKLHAFFAWGFLSSSFRQSRNPASQQRTKLNPDFHRSDE